MVLEECIMGDMANAPVLNDFLASGDTLRVYGGNELLFRSTSEGLLPLVDYINKSDTCRAVTTVFDRVVGNAAALLLIRANCSEVFSPLGSKLAAGTLDSYAVEYHFTEVVPYIRGRGEQDMCPMEKLSLNKSPGEFYEVILSLNS